MSTTTIRLPEDLKERVRQAAERTGQSPHGFILQAIVEKTEREARRQEFEHTAEQRYEQILATGETLPWAEMRRYLEERGTGKQAERPKARKLAP